MVIGAGFVAKRTVKWTVKKMGFSNETAGRLGSITKWGVALATLDVGSLLLDGVLDSAADSVADSILSGADHTAGTSTVSAGADYTAAADVNLEAIYEEDTMAYACEAEDQSNELEEDHDVEVDAAEGGSFLEAELEYSSTWTDRSASEFKNSLLNAFELDTNADEIDTFSHSLIGLNLKIILEIDHEDLYDDITSIP
ncbi:hypothetical protein L7F22_008097 [Adiantum nelumboides]|nr:hypothetical protein [Adiantum nelumboides]